MMMKLVLIIYFMIKIKKINLKYKIVQILNNVMIYKMIYLNLISKKVYLILKFLYLNINKSYKKLSYKSLMKLYLTR